MPDEKLADSLRMHFDSVASGLPDQPTLEELCEASSKEARLWAQPAVYQDLMESLQEQLDLRPEHRLLEVGCAAGFLAVGLAPRCREYVGVDLSAVAVDKARTLGLDGARFEVAEGAKLPFEDASFDRVLSYDVFTNFPDMSVAGPVAREMLRVTQPGGRALIGAIPDADRREAYFAHAQEVGRDLEARYGPRRLLAARERGWRLRLRDWYWRRVRRVDPTIVNHLFRKDEFLELSRREGVRATILPGHERNPYREFRFNVLLCKGA